MNDEGKFVFCSNDFCSEVKRNDDYRKIAWTGEYSQLVQMSLDPGSDIHWEKHDGDQHFFIAEGQVEISYGLKKGETEETFELSPGSMLVIPAGKYHYVVNTGDGHAKLFTIYAPPQH